MRKDKIGLAVRKGGCGLGVRDTSETRLRDRDNLRTQGRLHSRPPCSLKVTRNWGSGSWERQKPAQGSETLSPSPEGTWLQDNPPGLSVISRLPGSHSRQPGLPPVPSLCPLIHAAELGLLSQVGKDPPRDLRSTEAAAWASAWGGCFTPLPDPTGRPTRR